MMRDIYDKITYQAVYDASITDALHYARDNDFAGVQVAVEAPHLSYNRVNQQERREIREFTRDNRLMLSLHGPDDTTSLFEHNEYLRRGIFAYYTALFNFADNIGAKLITIHLGKMSTHSTDTDHMEMIPKVDFELYEDALRTNLNRLIDVSNGKFVLCVENYKLDEMSAQLLQPYLDNGRLTLCWDLAKTYSASKILERFFFDNIRHVKEVHLHDISPQGKSHRVIGSGVVDFRHYLTALNSAEVFEYCIEVRPREKALESYRNLQKLLGHK